MKITSCIVCNGTNWKILPSPHPARSVRSDGAILNQIMVKAQCMDCAMIQSMQTPDQRVLTTLYTDHYDIYNNRPGAEKFVANRYKALSKVFSSAVPEFSSNNKKILEVGCGNGSMLEAMQSIWNDASCVGIEPVLSAVKSARECGRNVYQGMIGSNLPQDIAQAKFDIIYSVHVIEHTDNPIEFLRILKLMLKPDGYILISCPNACVPNLELMRSDHNYSMTPYHLNTLIIKSGLIPIINTDCPGGAENLDNEHNQLVVARLPEKNDTGNLSLSIPTYLSPDNRIALWNAREKYFSDFANLDQILASRISRFNKVYCFGSGGWACILAGLAEKVWETITACVIDGGAMEEFHGKKILALENLEISENDGIIIGTNPAIQNKLANRLKDRGLNVVCWNNIIPF